MAELNFPKWVTVVDVSPRDGLQSESVFVPTEKKVELVHALISAGVPKVEVTSFVSPKWVPQLGDAEQVLSRVDRGGAKVQVLIPNVKGYERVRRTARVDEITFVVAATETLNRRNVNMSVADSVRQFAHIAGLAKADGVRLRGTIGVAFICPYEGRVPSRRAAEIAGQLFELGADEVALADTLGAATPDHVYELFTRVREKWPDNSLAGHFHDTNRLALANIVTAMQAGVDVFDAAAGGLGGCQFTDGARGNVATEQVVYMLERMGIETGIDYGKLVAASSLARDIVAPR